MIPSIGRIVLYILSESDADVIMNQRRVQPQSHVGDAKGNPVKAGDVFPMMITRVWGDTPESAVQGQVFLDGNDTLWVTSVMQGDGERQWHQPGRVG